MGVTIAVWPGLFFSPEKGTKNPITIVKGCDLTAATPMENPCCSCKLTRVRSSSDSTNGGDATDFAALFAVCVCRARMCCYRAGQSPPPGYSSGSPALSQRPHLRWAGGLNSSPAAAQRLKTCCGCFKHSTFGHAKGSPERPFVKYSSTFDALTLSPYSLDRWMMHAL